MCITNGKFERACGLLLLNEFNAFVYSCTQCQCEFYYGPELEMHILSEHQDEKGSIVGNDVISVGEYGPVAIEPDPLNVKVERCDEIVDELVFDSGIIEVGPTKIEDRCEPSIDESACIPDYQEESVEHHNTPLIDFAVNHDFDNDNGSGETNNSTIEVFAAGKQRRRPFKSKKRKRNDCDELLIQEIKMSSTKTRRSPLSKSKSKSIDSDRTNKIGPGKEISKSIKKNSVQQKGSRNRCSGMPKCQINEQHDRPGDPVQLTEKQPRHHSNRFMTQSTNHKTSSRKIKKQIQRIDQMCPIVGCGRQMKHFARNGSRHIKEFHGEELNSGNWVLVRHQCVECKKNNVEKVGKRPENLAGHYKNEHPGKKLKTIVIEIKVERPRYYNTQ